MFYIEFSPFTKIVFCDNGAYSYRNQGELIEYAKSKDKIFEWISFQGDVDKTKERGKGYGEGEIIQYALENSTVAQKAISIAKVTGRLKIENISETVKKVKRQKNYFNRDIYRGHGIDTRFFLCDKEFYCANLMRLYIQVREDNSFTNAIEDIYYRTLIKSRRKIRTLKAYPAFKGISGGNGRNYSDISNVTIKLYSLLCRVRIFNWFYAGILGFKKLRLVLRSKK